MQSSTTTLEMHKADEMHNPRMNIYFPRRLLSAKCNSGRVAIRILPSQLLVYHYHQIHWETKDIDTILATPEAPHPFIRTNFFDPKTM